MSHHCPPRSPPGIRRTALVMAQAGRGGGGVVAA
jgi:hypothetical protein